MGQPVRILDLARQMISLSGFEPDEDVAITFTGLRPGEKLHEELIEEGEVATTEHDRIRMLRSSRPAALDVWLPALEACVRAANVRATVRLLQKLVPSYRPSVFLGAMLGERGEHEPLTPESGNGHRLTPIARTRSAEP